jgi:uncharacterized protein YbaR (Trm112 family)
MKPLLLDILACPICKFFPLKLDILKWETPEKTFSTVIQAFHKKDIPTLIKATKIRRGKDRVDDAVIITNNSGIWIKDEMVRTKSNLSDYLKEVESKLENFSVIEDHSGEKYIACLNLIKNDLIKHVLDLKSRIDSKSMENLSVENQKEFLEEIKSDIYLINWYFQFSEIEEGVIYCEKCSRWYPIIETIPQMLPDELREKENEIGFLKKWESKLQSDIKERGNPFNLTNR